MNKDQKLLEEAYQRIAESIKAPKPLYLPAYFGPEEEKDSWMEWLQRNLLGNITINEDGSLTVKNSISLARRNSEDRLPFNFKEVGKWFDCSSNQFTSLEGSPEHIKGHFYCMDNKLTSLKGAPREVDGDFYCMGNKLTSLKGAPKEVDGDFYCHQMLSLVSLEGAPEKIGGTFVHDTFSDEDYKAFTKKRAFVDKNLDKEFDIDLEDF
jgi:hypothetical protein